MENRGRRGRRNRHTTRRTAPTGPTASTFGVKALMVIIVVVSFACYMLQYNSKNSKAKGELMMLVNNVNDIAEKFNVIQNSYQLLENKFAMCSQEFPELEKQMAAFKSLDQVMEANRIGWDPKNHSRLPYIDVKMMDSKKNYLQIPIKNTTLAKSINRLGNLNGSGSNVTV